MADVLGSDGSDLINDADGVTDESDFILGLGGHDTIYALGGFDIIHAGDGNDLIVGGAGGDFIDGEAGTDTAVYLDSDAGVTVSLLTGDGYGGAAQFDTLAEIENLTGSTHDDFLTGDNGTNVLSGDDGNDTLKGGGGADMLNGEWGDDTLKGGGGADTLHGGVGGLDTASYTASSAGVIVLLNLNAASGGDAEGDHFVAIECVTGSGFADTLWGNENHNVLRGMDGNDTLKGFGGSDTLWGGAGHDFLYGMDGVDTLRGEIGNDYLDGEAGADTMIGGLGNDTYIVDNDGDAVTESGGEGIDTVLASVSYALAQGADVETLATTNANGTADLMLFGNSSGNAIVGNNGDNILKGGGGTDQLTGRGGDDVYYVDSTSDTIVESAGQGNDEVWASASYTLTPGADVEILRTTSDAGVGVVNLTGNSSGNVVRGNNGNNVINGGDGDDELTGLGGSDSFRFNTALSEAFNIDVITDFNVTDDTVQLDDDIFSSSLGLGSVAGSQFVIGAAALDASHRIIYDDTTGAVYYDSDGVGGVDQIQFAELSIGLALTNFDFFVVT